MMTYFFSRSFSFISSPSLLFSLCLCTLCYFPLSLTGQVCSGGSITLTSQAEVDNFIATYGTCTFANSLRLKGDDITNVDSLKHLKTIGNSLFLTQVPNIENLDGFSGLKTIWSNLIIQGCSKLTNLDGFSNLTRINFEVRMSANNNLTSIDGLKNVTNLKIIRIYNNKKLEACCTLYPVITYSSVQLIAMYGNAGNCTKARILADPNTSTISLTEATGAATSDMVCKGATVEMKASGAFDFTWDADASLSATDIANPMITPTAETTYTVTARGCNNTVDTESFTVKVSEPATPADAGPLQIKLNTTDFTLAANTPTVGTGQWSRDRGWNGTNIVDPLAPNSEVELRIDKSVALIWTITNGACVSSDEVILRSKRDTDNDGIADDEDTCDDRNDKDGDGISDCKDICDDRNDKDGDGISDCKDTCDDRNDKDGDGISDCKDTCDDRNDKDGDGISDCKDTCDDRNDKDGDGISDCKDTCDDRIDSDEDGTPDCTDKCPNDPNKIEPDACGCGIPPQIDSDGDGIVNCMDDCPYDLNQYVDGFIQCGQTISGSTRLGQNVLTNYGDCSTETFNGRELFYKLVINTPTDIAIRFTEENPSGQPYKSTLFVLSDFCTPESCLGTLISRGTAATLVLSDLPAGDYFIAIDSRATYDNTRFELTVDCTGGSGSALLACEANNVLFEDFQGYEANDDIASLSSDWELAGNSTRPAHVQEVAGMEANKVLVFNRIKEASDVSLIVGDEYKGIYRVAWDMFIASNHTAYVNIMGTQGTGHLGAKYVVAAEEERMQNRWFTVEAYIDLDNDRYVIFTDNQMSSFSGDYVVNLNNINFYAAPDAHFNIDNICVSKVELIPTTTSRIAKGSSSITTQLSPSVADKITENKQFETTSFTIPKTLKVYPNPTTGVFNYQGALAKTTEITLTIFNQLGQVVQQLQLGETNSIAVSLELKDLPNGIYLMQVYGKELIDTQRIILQR